MGLFRKTTTPAPLPAQPGNTMSGRIAASANNGLDKMAQVYHRNPKLIGGLGAVAAALLLTRMKRKAP